jgi:hypothetical protein
MKTMEQIIAELSKVIRFKDSAVIGDIVLIVAKEPELMANYALITDIAPDPGRKKDEWWAVGLTLLSIPPQEMVWTLRTPQLTGLEIFTMGGEQRFVKAVDFGMSPVSTPSAPVSRDEKKAPFLKRVK